MANDTPKPKSAKITPPVPKIDPQVAEYLVILKPKYMMQVGTAEPFAVPPECIEMVEG